MNGPASSTMNLGPGRILARKTSLSLHCGTPLISFHRYFKRFESYSHDSEQPNVDISLKGSQGPVRVGYFSDISEASKKFITTCVRLGVPFSTDFNTPAGSQGVNRVGFCRC